MTSWVPYSVIALLSFGLWGLFTKLTVDYIDFNSALIYQTIGVVIVGLIGLALAGFKPAINTKGFSFGLLTGFAYAFGCLFYFIAASKGKLINVITLTALYPMVTIILSHYILHESITIRQGAGILLALTAILLMST